MERMIDIKIKRLPEGCYHATSDAIQGLVAQGRTVWETLEIARDVSRRLIEAQNERKTNNKSLKPINKQFHYPLVLEI